jgi:hypothetical protein
MLDYVKYLLGPALLGLQIYGMWLGGGWAWLGVGVLGLIMLVDMFLPRDFSMWDSRHVWIYDVCVTITMLVGFALLFAFAYLVGHDHFRNGGLAGAFVGTLVYGFVVSAPPVHELFHREQLFQRTMGRLGLALVGDPWREITHVVTHHLKVCTPADPDTAQRGDTIYRHFLRTFPGQVKDAYALERTMWTKRERAWWHPRNRWVRCTAGMTVFYGLLFVTGGLSGMLWTAAASRRSRRSASWCGGCSHAPTSRRGCGSCSTAARCAGWCASGAWPRPSSSPAASASTPRRPPTRRARRAGR